MNKNRFNSSRQGPAINDRINAKSVRVISEKGEMVGVLETREAIKNFIIWHQALIPA